MCGSYEVSMCYAELVVKERTAKTSNRFRRERKGCKRRSKASGSCEPHKIRQLDKDSLFV